MTGLEKQVQETENKNHKKLETYEQRLFIAYESSYITFLHEQGISDKKDVKKRLKDLEPVKALVKKNRKNFVFFQNFLDYVLKDFVFNGQLSLYEACCTYIRNLEIDYIPVNQEMRGFCK